MKQFVVIILLSVCYSITADAQSFLDRLQKQVKGKGTVTVRQNAAIDELVNGTKTSVYTVAPQKQKKTNDDKRTTTTGQGTVDKKPEQPPVQKENNQNRENNEKREPEKEQTESSSYNEMEIPTIDMRKKVMRKSYKVNGYRVQAFAGGNTRRDRQKAERTGNDIKTNFPDEPIYVHFYSPRWICRVGNYRSYEEAHRMLLEIRKLGYKQASIVKGKISVQY